MFILICARINGWVNNREAGELRCHRAHYDVIVMNLPYTSVYIGNGWDIWDSYPEAAPWNLVPLKLYLKQIHAHEMHTATPDVIGQFCNSSQKSYYFQAAAIDFGKVNLYHKQLHKHFHWCWPLQNINKWGLCPWSGLGALWYHSEEYWNVLNSTDGIFWGEINGPKI